MSSYYDYQGGLRSVTGFGDYFSEALIDKYNNKLNEQVELKIESAYSTEESAYVNAMNSRIGDYQSIIDSAMQDSGYDNGGSTSYQNAQIASAKMQELQAQLDAHNSFVQKRDELDTKINDQVNYIDSLKSNPVETFKNKEEITQATNVLNHLQEQRSEYNETKYAFTNSNEFRQFCVNAEDRGVCGVALQDRENGQYIFVTNKSQESLCQEIASDYNISMGTYSGYDMSGRTLADANQAFGQGQMGAYKMSLYATEAGKTQQKLEEAKCIIKGMTQMQEPTRAMLQEQFSKELTQKLQKSEDSEMLELFAEKDSKDKISTKDVIEKRTEILKNNEFIKIDKKGNISEKSLEDALKNGNISKKEADFLKATGLKAGKHTSMNSGVKMMARRLAREAELPINDFVHLAERIKQTKKVITTTKKMMRDVPLKVREVRTKKKELKKGAKDNVTKKKPKEKTASQKKREEKFEKRNNKKRDKLIKKDERRAKFWNSKLGKAIEKPIRVKRKVQEFRSKTPVARLKKRVSDGFKNSKLGKFLLKPFDFFATLKKKLMIYGSGTIITLSIISAVVAIIVTTIMSISAFFEKKEVQQTMGWYIYQELRKDETEWLKACADGDATWRQRENLLYGENYVSLESYVNSMAHASYNGGDIKVNPFNFTPMDEKALKTVTWTSGFDGGNEFTVTPSDTCDHTSNIKDILSMADVIFGSDLKGNSIMSQTMKQANDVQMSEDLSGKNGGLAKFCAGYVAMNNAKASAYDITGTSTKETPEVVDTETLYSRDDYANILAYCETLFAVTHQERIDLETVILPMKEKKSDKADATDTGDTGVNGNDVTVCPDGGCMEYDGFKWVFDNNGKLIFGLQDTNGKYHNMTSSVEITEIDYQKCINKNNRYAENEDTYKTLKGRKCWDETEGDWAFNDYHYGKQATHNYYDGATYKWDASTHTMIRTEIRYKKNPNYVKGEKSDKTKFYRYSEVRVSTLTHNCKGHKAKYCGGHLKVSVKGTVYGMTPDQVAYCTDPKSVEGKKVKDIFPAKYDKKTLDKSSITKASKTGLNISVVNGKWATDADNIVKIDIGSNSMSKTVKNFKDIFDCDYAIRYGNIFGYKWKQYEGWTTDNQLVACLKASADWSELYGFDIGANLGCGYLTEADRKAIVDSVSDYWKDVSGKKLSTERKKAIDLALSCVGDGAYDQQHHSHAYRYSYCASTGGNTCNITDCTGFCSFINLSFEDSYQSTLANKAVLNTEGYASGSALAPVRKKWSEYGSWDKIAPLSTIVHWWTGSSGNGGAHGMVYIGQVNKDIQLSDGHWVKKGYPITVDCTTLDHAGNIYLRNGGTKNDTGFSTQDFIQNPDENTYVIEFSPN